MTQPNWRRKRSPARVLLASLAVVAAAACTGSSGQPDDRLGGLVHSAKDEPPKIDLDKAARNIDALGRAVTVPHHHVAALLGAHTFAGTSAIKVREGGKEVEALSDTTAISFDAKGGYHAKLDNSKEYGREVFYTGGTMYLRPRYGKYHKRKPASDTEPVKVRDDIFSTLAANWELLRTRAELTDQGQVQVAGRTGKKIQIKSAPKDRPRGKETLVQRKWRESIGVTKVDGEVVLDTQTGMVLKATLSGTLQFSRDGKNFEMDVSVTHALSKIGNTPAITAPADDQTVATQRRGREPDDRQVLLEGIAPPAKRAPTPSNPTGGQ